VRTRELVLRLFDEAYEKKTWHGPNLRQAIRGVSAKEAAWRTDRELLEREHRALRVVIEKVLDTPRGAKLLRHIYEVALHDVYHAGQIRLLRRLMA